MNGGGINQQQAEQFLWEHFRREFAVEKSHFVLIEAQSIEGRWYFVTIEKGWERNPRIVPTDWEVYPDERVYSPQHWTLDQQEARGRVLIWFSSHQIKGSSAQFKIEKKHSYYLLTWEEDNSQYRVYITSGIVIPEPEK